MTDKGKISDQVEDFVPGRLVGIVQSVVDRPLPTKDQKIGIGQAFSQTLPAELGRLRLQDKGPAIGDLTDEALGSNRLGMDLPAKGGMMPIIQQITGPE